MSIAITIVGGGMITHDQILPSIYHLQRLGQVSSLQICALNSPPLKALADAADLKEAFPNMSFQAFPTLSEDPSKLYPDMFKDVIAKMPRHNLVVCATPDHLHYGVIKFALEHDQHVLTVKPLVLKYQQALEIEKLAHSRGLFVGVEYHKRFDVRALEARKSYRAGRFGEFRVGEAKLIEPWYYRHSNFQNWFTCENTDPFTYIGCHYVDLTYFITGLRPTQVSVQGVKGKFPNGNVGYLWSAGRVVFDNGAILSVVNGLGYPDEGAGSNDQGMTFFCESATGGGLISHNDQFRGVAHSYADGLTKYPFRFVSPDYLRLIPWPGDGLRPTGYGFWSIEANIQTVLQLNQASAASPPDKALALRQSLLERIDRDGILATPANSSINELVVEAARLSITHDGQSARIESGAAGGVRLL
jgi:predicted dehydrogenase